MDTILKSFLINVLLLFMSLRSSVLAQQSCFTPKWEMGRCVPYLECETIKRLSRYEIFNMKCEPSNSNQQFHVCCKNADIIVEAKPLSLSSSSSSSSPKSYEASLNRNGVRILNSMKKCGKASQKRISKGEEVILGEFPWMALLRYDSEREEFQCGGTLITNRYVLTAAHCMVGTIDKLIGVRLGEHKIGTNTDCATFGSKSTCYEAQDYGIAKKIPHPSYSSSRLLNDAALIKLDRDVILRDNIRPICLPITQRSTEIAKDQEYFISGWGYTEHNIRSDTLLKAKIQHKSSDTCQNIFKRVRFTSNHVCAGGDENTNSCRGDSGGPLFFLAPYKFGKRYVQYGIVSHGGKNCGALPSIFANVIDMMPWITSNID